MIQCQNNILEPKTMNANVNNKLSIFNTRLYTKIVGDEYLAYNSSMCLDLQIF